MQGLKPGRKALAIATALVILAVVAVLLMRGRSPFGGKNTTFAVSPVTGISRIEISDDKCKVTLVKKAGGWSVNEKYEARKGAVNDLLVILAEMQIKSPVSRKMFYEEITAKGFSPVKVRVFHAARLIRSFFVYRTGSNPYGNIMKMRAASKPFIVSLPGMEAELGSAFSTDPLYWQPFVLFDQLPSEISSVTLENGTDPSSSFTITNTANTFSLSNLSSGLTGWDTARVIRYLTYFTHVPFEAPATGLTATEKEEIIKTSPLYTITLVRKDGGKLQVTLRERWISQNGVRSRDTDRLWAVINGREELFIVRYVDIDPILKKSSYFFPG